MTVRGIIYMYTSPIGKSYIGQTYRENLRRKLWKSSRCHYAGVKIDRARNKYGKDNFEYEVLFEKNFASKEIAMMWLNIAEQYYIRLYNTVKNGYNCEYGGKGNAKHTGAINHHKGGYKLSSETRKKIGEASKRRLSDPKEKARMSAIRKGKTKARGYRIKSKYRPIVQLTLDGVYIKKFDSIRDAGESLAINSKSLRANISAVCRGRRLSAGGYKWMFVENYKIA